MTTKLAALAVALLAGSAIGFAAQNDQQLNPGSNGDTQHTGTEPPSSASNVPGRAQEAPQAPLGASGDTMPAKYSAKNAADDKLPIGAYRLKHLTDAQRQAIYRAVMKDKPASSASAVHAQVGAEVPSSVELMALPTDVGAQIPDTRDLKFATVRDTLVLVDPVNMMVVGVINQ